MRCVHSASTTSTCRPPRPRCGPGSRARAGRADHLQQHRFRRRRPMTMRMLWSLVLGGVLVFTAVSTSAQAPVVPPPPQVPYGAPISLEQAKKVMAGAEAEAMKNKWNVVITILDSGGNLVMMHRLDGTQFGSI